MGKSRKTKTKTKRRGASAKEQTKERERAPPARPEPMERVPSNAPTMAIAPSDYEHIFHEGPAGSAAVTADGPTPSPGANGNGGGIRTFPISPPVVAQPPPPLPPPPPPAPLPPVPNSTSVPFREMSPTARMRTRNDDGYSSPTNRQPANYYSNDLQVSPDGYTLLGQQPPEATGARRIALPAHIVRAGNQFSRAALVRVARYLASRSEFR